MRAARLIADGQLELQDIPEPPPPAPGEAQLRIRALALNHIDLWGFRGMAFAKRKLPITVGVEAVGEVVATAADVTAPAIGTPVVIFGGLICRQCRACRSGRENLCEQIGGIMGFHIDGMAAERINVPHFLLRQVPAGVVWRDAACAAVTFSTVQHMLFDNARLEPGETVLVHAGASGVGSTAIRMAKAIGATVIATVGSDAKLEPVRALGADHVLNYREGRFETAVRRLTNKRGVDVVFEHIGPDTWGGSLLSLARGGRLVTCGSTSGISAPTNLFQLFQQQLRITGSFGANFRNIDEGLAKMAAGLLPVIDTELPLADIGAGIKRLADRAVVGKIVVHMR